jgi:hypothetical protein
MFWNSFIRGLLTPQPRSAAQVVTPPRRPGTWPLDQPLLALNPQDHLTIRDCVTGIQILGAPGSGKTSGSLAYLADAMLRDGWGMLVLTTKPGEAQQWRAWAERAGRIADVLQITPDGQHTFNFLDYLDRHPDSGARVPTNIGDMLMTLARYAKPKSKGTESSEFFSESASLMATQAIHVLRGAGEKLTLATINRIISAAPKRAEELEKPSPQLEWLIGLLDRMATNKAANAAAVTEYWLGQFPMMNERTRGDVISTLSSVIFRFTEPPIAELIASNRGSSFIPELVTSGKVMILDCPVVLYQQAGRLFQIAIKHLVQQAVQRREPKDTTRPVAIIADEAQNFATHADYQYQAVCRDFRGCTVYATQTIDNYLEAVGSQAAVDALLSNLCLKILHANAGRTNEWAEQLIAKDWREQVSDTMNNAQEQAKMSLGSSVSQQISPQVLAAEFTRLRGGGPRYQGLIDAVVFQPGRRFSVEDRPFVRVTFRQR